jgi:hypothetical protein
MPNCGVTRRQRSLVSRKRGRNRHREYAHRTAVERVPSRLDVSFGCALHTIRGLAKMQARCSLALWGMLGRAPGRIRQQHPELLRSLVCST